MLAKGHGIRLSTIAEGVLPARSLPSVYHGLVNRVIDDVDPWKC